MRCGPAVKCVRHPDRGRSTRVYCTTSDVRLDRTKLVAPGDLFFLIFLWWTRQNIEDRLDSGFLNMGILIAPIV